VAVRSPDVAFLVLIGAPAVRGDAIVLRQAELIRAASHSSAALSAFSSELERQFIAAVEREPDDERAAQRMHEIWTAQAGRLPASGLSESEQEKLRQAAPSVDEEIKALTSPWQRYFLTYDPAPVLRKVHQPILALYGSLDLQSPPSQNRSPMEQALKSNKDHTVTELPGINHLMQPAKTGVPDEYLMIQTTIDPQVLRMISDWVSRHAGLPAASAG